MKKFNWKKIVAPIAMLVIGLLGGLLGAFILLTAAGVSVVLLYTVLAVLTPVSVELVKDTPAAVSRIKAPSKPPSKPITSIAIGATIFFQFNRYRC